MLKHVQTTHWISKFNSQKSQGSLCCERRAVAKLGPVASSENPWPSVDPQFVWVNLHTSMDSAWQMQHFSWDNSGSRYLLDFYIETNRLIGLNFTPLLVASWVKHCLWGSLDVPFRGNYSSSNGETLRSAGHRWSLGLAAQGTWLLTKLPWVGLFDSLVGWNTFNMF